MLLTIFCQRLASSANAYVTAPINTITREAFDRVSDVIGKKAEYKCA